MTKEELQEIADMYGLYTEQDVENRVSCELLGIGARNEELEKENAELKEQCSILADCNTCTSTCKTENIEMKRQLTNAKELLERFLNVGDLWEINGEKFIDLQNDVTQFLKESEVEKNEEVQD